MITTTMESCINTCMSKDAYAEVKGLIMQNEGDKDVKYNIFEGVRM